MQQPKGQEEKCHFFEPILTQLHAILNTFFNEEEDKKTGAFPLLAFTFFLPPFAAVSRKKSFFFRCCNQKQNTNQKLKK